MRVEGGAGVCNLNQVPRDSVTAPLAPRRTLLSTSALFGKSHFSLTFLIKLATQSLPTASQKHLPYLILPVHPTPPTPLPAAGIVAATAFASPSPNLQALSAPIHLAHCCQINLLKQWLLNSGLH